MPAQHFQFVYTVAGDRADVRVYAGPEGSHAPQVGTLSMPQRAWWELAEILMSAWPSRVDFVKLEAAAEVAHG